jgi:hypothetical protein
MHFYVETVLQIAYLGMRLLNVHVSLTWDLDFP